MSRPSDEAATDLSGVAAETPEESAEAEKQIVGKDEPDVGGTVPPDQEQ